LLAGADAYQEEAHNHERIKIVLDYADNTLLELAVLSAIYLVLTGGEA